MTRKPLLTESDVLAYLKISRATLYRWMEDPLFPKAIRVGNGVRGAKRWNPDDFDAWLDSRHENDSEVAK